MNRDLLNSFRQLDPLERHRLAESLRDAPVARNLLAFLEECAGENFQTSTAVQALYPDSAEPAAKLENRFYKLRKKLYEEITGVLSPAEERLTPEEHALYAARMEIHHSHYGRAIEQLEQLAATLWARNLFELLPDALDLTILCYQRKSKASSNTTLHEDYDRAVELQHTLRRLKGLARRQHEKNQYAEAEVAVANLRKLKRLARKHADYPRFQLIYHEWAGNDALFRNPTRQLTEGEYRARLRHLNAMEQLMYQHPEVPGLYWGPNAFLQLQHAYRSERYTLLARAGKMADALEQQERAWQLATRPGSSILLSGPDYLNRARLYTAVGKWPQAQAAARDYIEYQAGQDADASPGLELLAQIYVWAWPALDATPDRPMLIKRLQKAVDALPPEPITHQAYNLTSTQMTFLLISGEYKAALEAYQHPACRHYYEQMLQFPEQAQFLELVAATGAVPAKAELPQHPQWHMLHNRLEEIRHDTPAANHLHMSASWLLRFFR